jgi:hypothetical protein
MRFIRESHCHPIHPSGFPMAPDTGDPLSSRLKAFIGFILILNGVLNGDEPPGEGKP